MREKQVHIWPAFCSDRIPVISCLLSFCVCNNSCKKPTDLISETMKYRERDKLHFRQRTMANLSPSHKPNRCETQYPWDKEPLSTTGLTSMWIFSTQELISSMQWYREQNLRERILISPPPPLILHRNLATLEKALSSHIEKRHDWAENMWVSHCDSHKPAISCYFRWLLRSQAAPTTINRNYYTETWVTLLKQD